MTANWNNDRKRKLNDEVQEELANVCFIAIDNEVKYLKLDNDGLLDETIDEKPSYDELLNDFNDLHMKYEKLALKNIALKKKILSLQKNIRIFQKKRK